MPILDSGEKTADQATTASTDANDAPNRPRDNVDDRDTVEGSTSDVNELIDSGESLSFEEAMTAVEGRANTEETPDSDADTESSEADAEPTGEEEAPEETAETEEEPDEEADDDTEAAEAEEETEDDASDETDEEPEPETGRAEEFVENLNDRFEDTHFESLDDVKDQLERERQGNDALVTIADAHPSFVDFLGDVLQEVQQSGAANLDALAATHFKTDLPDPEEDPEAYEKAVQEREQRRAKRESERERLQQVRRDVEQLANTARASVETLAERRDLDEGEVKSFRRELADFINNPDESFAEVIYLGKNHQEIVEREKEKAYKKGKNEGIQERRDKQSGDGVAKLSSSETTSNEESEEPENPEAKDTLEVVTSGPGNPLEDIID